MQAACKNCQNSGRWKKGRFRDEADKARIYAINRASYERNKPTHQARANRRNAQNKLRALEAHGHTSCMRCGFGHPAALEFHHRDPTLKLFNVSKAVTAPDQYPWPVILAELEKCDVICANCHKIEHTMRVYDIACR